MTPLAAHAPVLFREIVGAMHPNRTAANGYIGLRLHGQHTVVLAEESARIGYKLGTILEHYLRAVLNESRIDLPHSSGNRHAPSRTGVKRLLQIATGIPHMRCGICRSAKDNGRQERFHRLHFLSDGKHQSVHA